MSKVFFQFTLNNRTTQHTKLHKWVQKNLVSKCLYSLPIQLLFHNLRKNQVLLVLWLFLFAIITENFGVMIGIPPLFLDPEYLNEVNFWSCAIVGFTLGVFMMSYHIICYILDSPKFFFIGNVNRPFTKFFLNNSLIPLLFLVTYIYCMLHFQLSYEENTAWQIFERISGLILGVIVSASLLFLYFIGTNKDIFKLLALQVDRRLKRTQVMRVNVLSRIKESRMSSQRVDYYLDTFYRLKQVDDRLYQDRELVLKVFDQNHLNAVIIQLTIFTLAILIGTLRDYPIFQLPAGASLILLFTLVLSAAGALNYWLRGWAVSVTIVLILSLNYAMNNKWIIAEYEAYGLDYQTKKAEYSLQRVKDLSNDDYYQHDKQMTLIALENWKNKFQFENPQTKPKMVFICASGGGIRAAMWTMRTLQMVDSTLDSRLMNHTMLMTGASGGLVGAAYFRELWLRRELHRRGMLPEPIDPYSEKYLENIAKDNLNAIVFSLVVNDIFFGFQTFEYAGKRYFKDRGFAFEQQLNMNTEGVLDKPLCDYKEPELLAWIPMLMLAPTIVNDGRKLFISPQNVSYMTVPSPDRLRLLNQKTKGIEFLRFFEEQGAENLRFLSALRMSATFPYVTPNVKLPSIPQMEIMDAGMADNFGVSDAVRFLYTFRDWISKNTSGVVFVTIRDTQKDKPIEKSIGQSLFQRIFTPVSSLYANLEYLQDITNDSMIEFAQSWFSREFGVHRVVFQYVPLSNSLKEIEEKKKQSNNPNQPLKIVKIEQAALSWRLTAKEKASIKRTIYELRNQFAIKQLENLLE